MTELMMARVAREARCSSRTVRRWLDDSGSVWPVVAYALERACERLGVTERGVVLSRQANCG